MSGGCTRITDLSDSDSLSPFEKEVFNLFRPFHDNIRIYYKTVPDPNLYVYPFMVVVQIDRRLEIISDAIKTKLITTGFEHCSTVTFMHNSTFLFTSHHRDG